VSYQIAPTVLLRDYEWYLAQRDECKKFDVSSHIPLKTGFAEHCEEKSRSKGER